MLSSPIKRVPIFTTESKPCGIATHLALGGMAVEVHPFLETAKMVRTPRPRTRRYSLIRKWLKTGWRIEESAYAIGGTIYVSQKVYDRLKAACR